MKNSVKGMKKFFRVTGSAIAAILVVVGCGKDSEVGNQQINWEDANNRPYRGAVSPTATASPTPSPYAMQIYDASKASPSPTPSPYAMQIYDTVAHAPSPTPTPTSTPYAMQIYDSNH
jgi:hypothetical protein